MAISRLLKPTSIKRSLPPGVGLSPGGDAVPPKQRRPAPRVARGRV